MKFSIAFISICISYSTLGQELYGTTHLSTVYLDEVVVLDKKPQVKKLGYLNKENFTFSLYKDYEIGTYVENTEKLNNVVDLLLKVKNEIIDEFEIEINFYDFNGKPSKLLRSINAKVRPSNKHKLILSHGGGFDIEFPKEGLFLSTKIKSNLMRDDENHFKVYLSQKYRSKSTFIRGAIYGNKWIEMSELNLRKGKTVNVCFGILAY